jgi:hypothetical protein
MRSLTCALALSCSLLALSANTANAANAANIANDHIIYTPVRGGAANGLDKATLIYHGGPVIISAKVVFIFWGPSFNNPASPDYTYARTLQTYRNGFGTTREYKVITQYSGIMLANLGSGTADWFDSSTPPTNVTDANVQAEVRRYLALFAFNASTIYEVVIPSTSYSSSGSSTSCGGPGLSYCAYHSWIGSGASAIKYSIQPYPSCAGCQVSGWSAVQNQEHFVCHETREAVTDPTGTAWFTATGYEADDLCAWSPPPFLDTGGAFQYEWSNLANACVKF